jgi:CTP-dependent riboflavin kinase
VTGVQRRALELLSIGPCRTTARESLDQGLIAGRTAFCLARMGYADRIRTNRGDLYAITEEGRRALARLHEELAEFGFDIIPTDKDQQ